MSDDTMPEAAEASRPLGAPDAPAADGAPGNGATSGDGQPPRRRRRGSRGGRNRRKKPAAVATNGAAEPGGNNYTPHDYTDASADRGLTTDDLAEDAREDAGLPSSEEAAATPRIGDRRPAPAGPTGAPAGSTAPGADARPKIGDTRPAPPPAVDGTTAPKKRRRRRGGRGRGRGTGSAAKPADRVLDDVVRADLGVGEAPALALDDDVLERRRGRTRKGRPAGRYLMCVHVLEGGHTHIAVLEGRNLVEHSLATPTGNESIDGNIYLGRVQNVLPGMEAAFVDIGTPKNGVLYRGDVAFDESEMEGGGKPRIERMLKNGQPVLVQVTKNPIAHKGARLTQEVSLAGRFLVMVPGEPDTYGISKRLPDDERRRLRRILDALRPADAGLIVRTAAEGATREELERDVQRLRSQWEQISTVAAKAKPPRLVYQEPDLVLRLIREEFTKEYRGIVIDDRALYEETRGYVEAIAPELAERVEFYDVEDEGLPLFERFHISEQLLKALDRKVWLPSGGSLVIERTEALTVIDVNTGKNVGRTNLEETVFRNNLEAAEEVARQLRLRDIGGIIVIDFIDMEVKANREQVMRVFRDALARDKTRTQAFDMSELGLVEMTRKRISEGLVESFSETCPTCHGRGFLLDESLLRSMD
ncbi:MAG TPA: Rne/Rng family ribonuclease [Acidimicrobiia bacterium]|nr:Rne/Rng family ribonuclease [Acidimicrobiia bacterium]